MEVTARRDERSYALIANFHKGFAVGWKMAVPEAFKEALDIRLTPRRLSGHEEMLWTQGRIFDFHEGDLIHNTSDAYQVWSKALKCLILSVQVLSASPSRYITYETIKTKLTNLDVVSKKSTGQAKEETVDGLEIKKQRLDHGVVRFRIMRPNADKSAVVECGDVECTQDDFVAFLQTGIVRTKENKFLDLFEEYAQHRSS